MNLIIAILLAVVAFFGILALDKARTNVQRRKSLRSRLAGDGTVYEDGEQGTTSGLVGEPSPRAQKMLALLRSMGINTNHALHALELKLAQAGVVSPDAPAAILFFKRVLSIPIAGLGLLLLLKSSTLDMQAVGFLVMILALFGANLYIDNKIANRQKLLQRAFPDTLDLMLICVESGLALDASLARVCNELARAYPEMTKELNQTRLELSLLNDRVKALMNLGDRTGMVAFRSLIVALIQSERFGTSLSDTLRVLSEDFRLQRLAAAEAKAARLPVLITLPLMVLLMPALFMIILGPAVLSMTRSSF